MTTAAQVKELIAQGKGQNIEFKREFTTALDVELVAFANTNDGVILIGVQDNGEICGARNRGCSRA